MHEDVIHENLYRDVGEIKERLAGMDEKLRGIHDQTKKTNGRVDGLETADVEINSRVNKMIGGLVLANIILVPIFVAAIIKWMS